MDESKEKESGEIVFAVWSNRLPVFGLSFLSNDSDSMHCIHTTTLSSTYADKFEIQNSSHQQCIPGTTIHTLLVSSASRNNYAKYGWKGCFSCEKQMCIQFTVLSTLNPHPKKHFVMTKLLNKHYRISMFKLCIFVRIKAFKLHSIEAILQCAFIDGKMYIKLDRFDAILIRYQIEISIKIYVITI